MKKAKNFKLDENDWFNLTFHFIYHRYMRRRDCEFCEKELLKGVSYGKK